MKKILITTLSLSFFFQAISQNNNPRIELYTAPGLFLEKLNYDSLVPTFQRGNTRFSTAVSFATQYSYPLFNQRIWVKMGIGYSKRYFSLTNTGLDQDRSWFLPLGNPPRQDSIIISYIKFRNTYLQIPISISLIRSHDVAKKRTRALLGLNLRFEYLMRNNAEITAYSRSGGSITKEAVEQLKSIYTKDATKWVVVLSPFIEFSSYIHKNLGMFLQFEPVSLYASKLNSRVTASTIEFYSYKFGFYYSIQRTH